MAFGFGFGLPDAQSVAPHKAPTYSYDLVVDPAVNQVVDEAGNPVFTNATPV